MTNVTDKMTGINSVAKAPTIGDSLFSDTTDDECLSTTSMKKRKFRNVINIKDLTEKIKQTQKSSQHNIKKWKDRNQERTVSKKKI